MRYKENSVVGASRAFDSGDKARRYRNPPPDSAALFQSKNWLGALTQRSTESAAPASRHRMANAMTVDVEDYFQVSAFENYIARDSWSKLECRVNENTDRILDTFSQRGIKATFFTLGWVGERYASMLKRIVAEGHELASHGWDHIRVVNFTPEQFREDVIKAKTLLEDLSGSAVKGYRAPSYSISEQNLWAHDILLETGHTYSSSLAPIKYRHYGLPDAPRFAHHRQGEDVVGGDTQDAILEVPITTVRIGNKNYPCGGGGWFRLYPYQISRMALDRVNKADREACVFYFHPWEIDVEQPRQPDLDLKTRFRHYQNLSRMEGKLNRLLGDFDWRRMDQVFKV